MISPSSKTPVIILTGFLGAGKTTLLQKILRAEHYGDSAVLINEFGEIGIDQQLVAPISPNTILLSSGCLCCQIRGELKQALLDLLDQRARGQVPHFQRIIIETTGLAEPTPIVATLQADPVLCHQLSIRHISAVVDAVNGAQMLAQQHPVWMQQIIAADSILLAKSDIAPAAAHLREQLRRLLPHTPILMHSLNDPAPELDAPDASPAPALAATAETAACAHGNEAPESVESVESAIHRQGHVHSLSLNIDTPIDWIAFSVWLSALLHAHGAAIWRLKGILNVGEAYPVLINGVQHMIYPPQHLADWPEDTRQSGRRSQLVIIANGLDPERIEASFRRHVLGETA